MARAIMTFARAALAGDQHGGPRIGHAADHLETFKHPRVAADDVVHSVAAIELRRRWSFSC